MKDKIADPIGRWLAAGTAMLLIQVMLGGITRLTGSGLPITEWQPLLGILPPLDKNSWMRSFHLYQQIAQFKQLNSDFSLQDYQHIYLWEWLHREWARLMALVFAVPFLYFLAKKMFPPGMTLRLTLLFFLCGLQGTIGWVMVQSGLNDTDIRVSHIRLVVHFMMALLLLLYVFWLCLERFFPKTRLLAALETGMLLPVLLFLLSLQLVYGALMAGTRAALSSPTWPDMNGRLVPRELFFAGAWEHHLFYHPLVIQFIHRSLAYVITVLILIWFLRNRKTVGRLRWVPLLLVGLQVCLGILALIYSPFRLALYFSVFHQLTGILLLLSLIALRFMSRTSLVASAVYNQ